MLRTMATIEYDIIFIHGEFLVYNFGSLTLGHSVTLFNHLYTLAFPDTSWISQ